MATGSATPDLTLSAEDCLVVLGRAGAPTAGRCGTGSSACESRCEMEGRRDSVKRPTLEVELLREAPGRLGLGGTRLEELEVDMSDRASTSDLRVVMGNSDKRREADWGEVCRSGVQGDEERR